MLRDFFLGFVRIHILHHAAQDEVYGAALIEELRRHGYDLSPGTLYPILHSMERAGYLSREERTVRGKVRKYYVATPAGRATLEEARGTIADLVSGVLETNGLHSLTDSPGSGQRFPNDLISPDDLWSSKGSGVAWIVIDVRSDAEYAAGHLPGAIHVPSDALSASLHVMPLHQLIVVYCNLQHPGNARSERAAWFLRGHGRTARVLAGGFPAWRDGGYAVERGTGGSPGLSHR